LQPPELVIFGDSRPFEPFRIYVSDGRQIDVLHPEMVMVANHGEGLWLFYEAGEVEVVAADGITSLRTLHAINPHNFVPRRNED